MGISKPAIGGGSGGSGGSGVEHLIFMFNNEPSEWSCNKTFEEAWELVNAGVAVVPIIVGNGYGGSSGNSGGLKICNQIYLIEFADSENVIECTYYSYYDSAEVGVFFNSSGEISYFTKSWE